MGLPDWSKQETNRANEAISSERENACGITPTLGRTNRVVQLVQPQHPTK